MTRWVDDDVVDCSETCGESAVDDVVVVDFIASSTSSLVLCMLADAPVDFGDLGARWTTPFS